MKYYDNILGIVKKSLDSINEIDFNNVLEDCYKVIKSGGKLIFSGLGKNVPICEKIVGTLNSLGIQANFLHTNTAMHGDLGMIQEKDLTFVLSKSGNTAESLLLANYLVDRNDKAYSITFNKNCELNKILSNSLTIELEHEGDNWNIVPNNSSTVYLILLQGLALQLADKLGIKLQDFKRNHPGGAIGDKLKNVK